VNHQVDEGPKLVYKLLFQEKVFEVKEEDLQVRKVVLKGSGLGLCQRSGALDIYF
jgi:hypothetical protein